MRHVLLINGSPNPNGATGHILTCISDTLDANAFDVQTICLGECRINYCKGCKACYSSAQCLQDDDVSYIMECMDKADIIVIASPSYWGDITGQLKVFFDRCTPYCNGLHPPKLPGNKMGYAIALRTGSNSSECRHIIESIHHFYGHMNIPIGETSGLYFCGIENPADIASYNEDIIRFSHSLR